MKQLISTASNLLVAIQESKNERLAIPTAEIVISVVEPVYRLVNNQLVREQELTDSRFTVDRAGIKLLINNLQLLEVELNKLEEHFDETQAKLPL